MQSHLHQIFKFKHLILNHSFKLVLEHVEHYNRNYFFYCVSSLSSLLNLLKLVHVFVSMNSYEKSSWGWNDKKKKEEMTEDKAW